MKLCSCNRPVTPENISAAYLNGRFDKSGQPYFTIGSLEFYTCAHCNARRAEWNDLYHQALAATGLLTTNSNIILAIAEWEGGQVTPEELPVLLGI